MFFWYAYRLDILAGGEFIARGCPGTGANGRCYFDEFLRYIQKSDQNPWRWDASVGTNLLPNIDQTVQKLSALHYSQNIDPRKLIGVSKGVNFLTLFGPVVDNIQKCRRIVGNLDIDEELSGVRESMAGMNDARVADQASFTIKDLNALLEKKGYSWKVETKTVKGLGANEWQEVDIEATMEAHSDAPNGLRDTIDNYILNYGGSEDPKKSNKRHARAIAACALFENRLLGDPSC